jgi:hypothetical protein
MLFNWVQVKTRTGITVKSLPTAKVVQLFLKSKSTYEVLVHLRNSIVIFRDALFPVKHSEINAFRAQAIF